MSMLDYLRSKTQVDCDSLDVESKFIESPQGTFTDCSIGISEAWHCTDATSNPVKAKQICLPSDWMIITSFLDWDIFRSHETSKWKASQRLCRFCRDDSSPFPGCSFETAGWRNRCKFRRGSLSHRWRRSDFDTSTDRQTSNSSCTIHFWFRSHHVESSPCFQCRSCCGSGPP